MMRVLCQASARFVHGKKSVMLKNQLLRECARVDNRKPIIKNNRTPRFVLKGCEQIEKTYFKSIT